MTSLKRWLLGVVLMALMANSLLYLTSRPVAGQDGEARSLSVLVLVNSTGANFADFAHYIQPYLDHFGVPYTVLDIVHTITPSNWESILAGIAANIAPYQPVYVTMDYAAQYARAMVTSDIAEGVYDPLLQTATVTLTGSTDIPTQFYLFAESGGSIIRLPVDVPVFSGSDDYLLTRRIIVPEDARLSFWHTYQLEQGGDGAVVEISVDDGLPSCASVWPAIAATGLSGGTLMTFASQGVSKL